MKLWLIVLLSSPKNLEELTCRDLRKLAADEGQTCETGRELQATGKTVGVFTDRLDFRRSLDLFSEAPSNYHMRNSDFYIPRFNSLRHEKHSLTFFGPTLVQT